jgi:histidinol-phosphate aminotransferase
VTALGSYPTFRYFVAGYGGEIVTVPYREHLADLSRLVDEARRVNARLLYLANPDNPTGTYHGRAELTTLIDGVPPECALVLDEAYIDFVPPQEVLTVDCDDPRVIRLRTFSKAHGMAGMRIGYALASREIVAAFNKVRTQFGVNRLAQVGALASLQDPAFVRGVVEEVARGRSEYHDLGREVGIPTLPSWTNFVAFDLAATERAQGVMKALTNRDVFVRTGAPPLDCLVRVTVGTRPERAAFAAVFREVIAG